MAPTGSTVSLKKSPKSSTNSGTTPIIESPTGFRPLVDRGAFTAPYIDGTALSNVLGSSPAASPGVFPES